MGCRSAELWAPSLPASYCKLRRTVKNAIDHIHLLFASQSHEVHCITRDSDCKRWVFFRMFHGVEQHGAIEHVHIHVVSARAEERIQYTDEIVDLVFRSAARSEAHRVGEERRSRWS